jgi:hypothetical protein
MLESSIICFLGDAYVEKERSAHKECRVPEKVESLACDSNSRDSCNRRGLCRDQAQDK